MSVRGIGASAPGTKRPGLEIDHSLPPGAEAETELNDTSSPHI
jgi:hypothetical protein